MTLATLLRDGSDFGKSPEGHETFGNPPLVLDT